MIYSFAKFCTSLWGVRVFCSTILIVCIFAILRLWFLKNKLDKTIKNIINRLKDLQDPNEFYNRYEDINEVFENDPYIGNEWKNFKKSLIFPSSNTSNSGIIQTSAPAKFFFDPETYLNKYLCLSFFNSVPNYLTGGGILFTFVGLACGIYLAREGFDSGNVSKITISLLHLLGGASLAFWTSIWGLICSIAFSMILKWCSRSSFFLLEELLSNIDRLIPFVTSEKLAKEQLEELKVQSTQLQRFNTELAVSIAEALDRRLSHQLSGLATSINHALTNIVNENLIPHLKAINNTMESIKTDRGESLVNMLHEISDKFRESLHGAAGKELNALALSVNNLIGEIKASEQLLGNAQKQVNETVMVLLNQAKDVMGELSETMKESSEKTVSNLKDTSKEISNDLTNAGKEVEQKFREAALTIEKAIYQFRDITEQIQTSLVSPINSLKQLVVDFSSNIDKLKSTTQESGHILEKAGENAKVMTALTEQIKNTISHIEKTAFSFEGAAQNVLESTEKSHEIHEEMKLLFKEMQHERQSLTSLWNMYQQRFAGLDESLKKIFEEINEGLNSYVDRLRDYVVDMEKYLSKGVDTLSGAVGELREAIEDLSETFYLEK